MQACVEAGIAKGEVVHVDATLIRADVAWDRLAQVHAEAVRAAHRDEPEQAADPPPDPPTAPPPSAGAASDRKPRRAFATDPDAVLVKFRANLPARPAYKQHTAVDTACGVVLDIAVTTGSVHEGTEAIGQIDAVAATTGATIRIVLNAVRVISRKHHGRNSHGALCRDRRLLEREQRVRGRCDRQGRPRGQGCQRAGGACRLFRRFGLGGEAH